MLVRIIQQMSGTMADGRDWPGYLGLTEVSDADGADLVRAQIAGPADGIAAERLAEMGVTAGVVPLPGEPAAGQATEPAAEPEAEPIEAASSGEAAAEPQAEAGPVAEVPAQNAPKQAWVDWAVASGADPEQAAEQTKADLISQYGGRM